MGAFLPYLAQSSNGSRKPVLGLAGGSNPSLSSSQDERQVRATRSWPNQRRDRHSSGIPALRRPSYTRSFASTRGGSPPCAE